MWDGLMRHLGTIILVSDAFALQVRLVGNLGATCGNGSENINSFDDL
jgi:hypothetical protein